MSAFTKWFFEPVPAARLAWLRVIVGAYAVGWLCVRLPAHLDQTDQIASRWDPVGVLTVLDRPPGDAVVVGVALLAPLLGFAFVAGWKYRVVAPMFAITLLVILTLDSSWGQVFHTENLLLLHVVVLALAPVTHVRDELVDGRYGWPLRLMAIVVAIAYVTAGIAKLRASGWGWLDGDVLRNLVAHDNLRKALLGDAHSPLGTAAVGHAWLFAPMAVFTLVVELGAPIALVGRRWRDGWVAAALLFHAGVLALMAVVFPYQLVGVAFACLYPVERIGTWLVRAGHREFSPVAAP